MSGNPASKRRGTKAKATMAAEALLTGGAQSLARKCIAMALSGDGTALRLSLVPITCRYAKGARCGAICPSCAA
jgi:hypothetical protein